MHEPSCILNETVMETALQKALWLRPPHFKHVGLC